MFWSSLKIILNIYFLQEEMDFQSLVSLKISFQFSVAKVPCVMPHYCYYVQGLYLTTSHHKSLWNLAAVEPYRRTSDHWWHSLDVIMYLSHELTLLLFFILSPWYATAAQKPWRENYKTEDLNNLFILIIRYLVVFIKK